MRHFMVIILLVLAIVLWAEIENGPRIAHANSSPFTLPTLTLENDAVEKKSTDKILFSPEELKTFHVFHVNKFEESAGNGRSRIWVAPANKPIVSLPNTRHDVDSFFMLKRELIGILLDEKPVAYDTTGIENIAAFTRTKKNAQMKTRSLDKHETAALDKLRQGEEIIVSENVERVSIVGAIRAKKDCIGCHECNEGTLLGAFSYKLVRADEWKQIQEKSQRQWAEMFKSNTNK